MLFLNYSMGDTKRAAKRINKYYKQKHSSPEFFKNRNLDSEEIQKSLDTVITVDLPVTPDNCFTICNKLRSFDPEDYDFDACCKVMIMKAEACTLKNGPRDGIIFINDMEGSRSSHMLRPKINSIRKSLKFLQEAAPLKIKAIHIMNCTPFVNKAVAMVKPFIRSEVMNKIHFHLPNMNYGEFQQKFGLLKSHLPSDYGGDLQSLEEMHTEQREEMMELREYFSLEEAQTNYEYDQFLGEIEKLQAEGQMPK